MATKKAAKKKTTKKATKRATSPPFPEHPDWTTAKFWSYIRSGLRSKWMRWPPRYKALELARRKSLSSNKRLKYEFQCALCEDWFQRDDVEVDHIEACGKLQRYEDLPGFVKRLFVGVDKLRVLCKQCHRVTTQISKEMKNDQGT